MIDASCHCGAIRLETARRPRTLTACNCSICRRYGALWAYYTRPTVKIHCRRDALARYAYGRRTFVYHHCRRCGCVTHYTRAGTANDARIAVNARMMAPEAIASTPVRMNNVRKTRTGRRKTVPRRARRSDG